MALALGVFLYTLAKYLSVKVTPLKSFCWYIGVQNIFNGCKTQTSNLQFEHPKGLVVIIEPKLMKIVKVYNWQCFQILLFQYYSVAQKWVNKVFSLIGSFIVSRKRLYFQNGGKSEETR